MKALTLTALITALAFTATANAGDDDITGYTCTYNASSAESGKLTDKLTFVFLVNHDERTAQAMGNQMATTVAYIKGGADQFTLLELTSGGNVMTTTITRGGYSVHSRNTIILGNPVPSQFYGTCTNV